MLPSGSLNQATFVPSGVVQTPSARGIARGDKSDEGARSDAHDGSGVEAARVDGPSVHFFSSMGFSLLFHGPSLPRAVRPGKITYARVRTGRESDRPTHFRHGIVMDLASMGDVRLQRAAGSTCSANAVVISSDVIGVGGSAFSWCAGPGGARTAKRAGSNPFSARSARRATPSAASCLVGLGAELRRYAHPFIGAGHGRRSSTKERRESFAVMPR
jgi:hypothetical protein